MTRWYGSLTAPEIHERLDASSVLCLPIGSYEQHGPHLPLHTDSIIAEQFTTRLVERYGDQHDLWTLPTMPFGLSLEHAWSPGTVSLRLSVLTRMLDAIVGASIRATPARKILIVNGHGGNRGILEAAVYELEQTHRVRICVVHPSSLSMVRIESPVPEVHAGTRETSVMLALAPEDVHLDRLDGFIVDEGQRDEVRTMILDRGATWPWNSGDPRIASQGIIGGDPRNATRDLGESVIASAIDHCATVMDRL